MKKIPALLCAATVLTVMTACSTPTETAVSGPSMTAPASSAVTSAAPSAVPSTAPSAMPSESVSVSPEVVPPATTGSGETPKTAETSTAVPEPDAGPLQELNLNPRGNVPIEVGQAGTLGEATGDKFADLTVDQIDTDFKCTAPGALPSINGQYIALTLSLSVNSNFADSGWPSLAMSAPDFSAWDSSGTRLSDPIGNSASCVEPDKLLPSPIEPGTTEKGMVVLDVAPGSGSAAYVIGGFEGSYGWEWGW